MAGKTLCAALLLAGLLSSQGKLIFLGDSYTDGGVAGILSGGQLVEDKLSTGEVNDGIYPGTPYYLGTFSNGPVWAEVTAENVGQRFDNFATGGANGEKAYIRVVPPYGYVSAPTQVPTRSLVAQAQAVLDLKGGAINAGIDFGVIFIGIDEIYQVTGVNGTGPDEDTFGDAVSRALNLTYTAGIRRFAVLTIPPLDQFPFAANASNGTVESAVSSYNDALTSAVNSFNSSNDDATVSLYNTSTLFEAILANPKSSEWGSPFTNVKDPARSAPDGDLDTTQASGTSLSNAGNPAGYLFWDEVHATKHFHHVLANDFSQKIGGQLNAAPAPAGTYT